MQLPVISDASTQRLHAIANVFIIGVGIAVAFQLYALYAKKTKSVERYANDVMKACSSAKSKQACYDEVIPQLMARISLEEVFAVTNSVQQRDPTYVYCHILGHRVAAQEVVKNPEQWQSVIPTCLRATNSCSAGCIHGAVQEKYKAEILSESDMRDAIAQLREVCATNDRWDFTPLQQINCYHALGHLGMYVTGGDIKKSLSFCKEVAEPENENLLTESCYSGAFMSIFQPFEQEDKNLVALKAPSRDTLRSFCMGYEGTERAACWREGRPLFSPDIYTPDGLQKFCAGIPLSADGLKQCYVSVISAVTSDKNHDKDFLKSFCNGMSTDAVRDACVNIVASRMVQTNPWFIHDAVSWCSFAHDTGSSDGCYTMLAHYARVLFHPASADLFAYCAVLPEPWSSRCKSLKEDEGGI